jgi:hypothetical protein
LCDGLRATHTLDPSQTIIVYGEWQLPLGADRRDGAAGTHPHPTRHMGEQMHQSSKNLITASLAGRLGVIQVVARDADVLLNVQGIERGTDGHDYRSHIFTPMSWNEAIRPRGLLDEAIASMQPPTQSLLHRGN